MLRTGPGSATADGSAFVNESKPNQRTRDDHGPVASGARFSQSDIASRICARWWAEAFGQLGIPKDHTGLAEEMYEAVNAGWMDLGVESTEHVAVTTSARNVFETARNATKA
ncbi:hypothetical protein [Acetobacter aceti]|uniref:Uncharacterized protein n=1 Tax=Acetobacter aceti TaxID=435 RepID=A0A6S6PMN1_ACEAC|nr:hypothetical protein [Acetobacter aceti]BCI68573.1 hypothetical protein AAJCM20276_31970 [Acetobacter aceti]